MTAPMLVLRNIAKDFTLHLRGGNVIPVMRDVSFDVRRTEAAAN